VPDRLRYAGPRGAVRPSRDLALLFLARTGEADASRHGVRTFSMSLRKRMSGLALECSRKAISSFNGFCARYSKVGDHEVFDHRDFPWLPAIEADWRKVRAELDAILPYMAHMQNFHDVLPNYLIQALPNYLIQGEGWKKYFFYAFGLQAPKNCRRCPESVKLLKRIPGMKTAFFSILGPHKYVPAHCGPFKGVLRLLLRCAFPNPPRNAASGSAHTPGPGMRVRRSCSTTRSGTKSGIIPTACGRCCSWRLCGRCVFPPISSMQR
jgi:Aspartyl/Asparaginyl beta-hydroxylase